MADRVVLHVGLPKTGTTYVQQLLWANRDRLQATGVHLVVQTMRELYDAARDLGHGGAGDWRRLVEAVHATPGTVILSCEGFSAAPAHRAEQAIAELQPAKVQVVCSLRDLALVLPSVWQQHVRTGSTVELGEFVGHVRDGMVWAWLPDPLEVLDAWSSTLDVDDVRLVTVPPVGTDPSVLWHRFAVACDLEPAVAVKLPTTANPSLPEVQIELLRRINLAFGDRRPVEEPRYRALVRPVQGARAAARSVGPPATLVASDRSWATEQAKRLVTTLTGRGSRVVGNLDDLVPGPAGSAQPPADPGAGVTEAELASAAVELAADVLLALRNARRAAGQG